MSILPSYASNASNPFRFEGSGSRCSDVNIATTAVKGALNLNPCWSSHLVREGFRMKVLGTVRRI